MNRTEISLPETSLAQAEIIARQLGLSLDSLIETAVDGFIAHHQTPTGVDAAVQPDPATPAGGQTGTGKKTIDQGDIYWVQVDNPNQRAAGVLHPHVIIQENVFNHSRIHTVVACALTTNLLRVDSPGNVLLEMSEANLPKQSVVEVSKISSIDKAGLGDYIGTVEPARIEQILAGLRFLHRAYFSR